MKSIKESAGRLLIAQAALLGLLLWMLLSGDGGILPLLALALAIIAFLQTLSISKEGRRTEAKVEEVAAFLGVKDMDDPLPGIKRELESATDLTDKRLKEALSRVESYEILLERMRDGMALIEEDGGIIICNDGFRKIYGIKADKAEQLSLREVVRSPILLQRYDQFLDTGKAIAFEAEVPPRGGRFFDGLICPIPLPGGGEGKRALLMLHDISRQRSVERMRVDFVANVSHELKTPLAAIRGFAETMLDGALEEPAVAKNFLATIQRHAERLTRLIEDLLTLSNIELGDDKMELTEIEPTSFLHSIEQMFGQTAKAKGLLLETAVEKGSGSFMASRDRLTQVMINLVDNGLKHTAEGAVRIEARRIEITPQNMHGFDYNPLDGNPLLPADDRQEWRKRFVEFKISDSGEGIPQDALPRLMERFYRVDQARSRELGGTGLGLSIVKHILIAHGGSIKIESKQGRGTSVRFIIPA